MLIKLPKKTKLFSTTYKTNYNPYKKLSKNSVFYSQRYKSVEMYFLQDI